MSDVRVPLAHDEDGADLTPLAAADGVDYWCPECAQRVRVRGGKKDGKGRRRHFFHINPTTACAFESDEHLLAKYTIAAVALDWIARRGPRPEIVRTPCERCGAGRTQKFPLDIDRVGVEKRLPNSLRKPDVLFYAGTATRFGVEVFKENAVDEDKAADLAGFAWCEVVAADVLSDPYTWRLAQDRLRKWDCVPCERELERERKEQARQAMLAAERAQRVAEDVARRDAELRAEEQARTLAAMRADSLRPFRNFCHAHKTFFKDCSQCPKELDAIFDDLASCDWPAQDAMVIFLARRGSMRDSALAEAPEHIRALTRPRLKPPEE